MNASITVKGRRSLEKTKHTCHRCGQMGHFGRDPECPAKGKTCKTCGDADQLASQYRTKTAKPKAIRS